MSAATRYPHVDRTDPEAWITCEQCLGPVEYLAVFDGVVVAECHGEREEHEVPLHQAGAPWLRIVWPGGRAFVGSHSRVAALLHLAYTPIDNLRQLPEARLNELHDACERIGMAALARMHEIAAIGSTRPEPPAELAERDRVWRTRVRADRANWETGKVYARDWETGKVYARDAAREGARMELGRVAEVTIERGIQDGTELRLRFLGRLAIDLRPGDDVTITRYPRR